MCVHNAGPWALTVGVKPTVSRHVETWILVCLYIALSIFLHNSTWGLIRLESTLRALTVDNLVRTHRNTQYMYQRTVTATHVMLSNVLPLITDLTETVGSHTARRWEDKAHIAEIKLILSKKKLAKGAGDGSTVDRFR